MNVRVKLCEVVKDLKDSNDLSYSDIISMVEEKGFTITRSQLSYILCHDGKNISIELIEKVISIFEGDLNVIFIHKSEGDF